ncbi:MAG: DegT/DnrJ/EryC1/StrS family aminotransferase [Pseudomonadota bacterium]|nr:DegT/DnrJ/EryC1/StrS family aminotransferase [Pseudomonadota bacterium]MDP1903392.1 DegT/DnrJ/EryC1/StrS family aminotransferase [Pseudomonadota bacterium]MDP2352362.1 DegT/DnrJ/EryC1/StrS family aminotransferase [Pseudomonadota bacterium]
MSETIRLARPWLDAEELQEIAAVLATGYLTQGPKTVEFEQAVSGYLGVEHAVATTSATTALHLAMVALEVGPGDEVIVPSFTFPATVNVVIQQGAVPVLADIDLASFNLSTRSLAECITPRTKAVMAVHLFGLPASMPEILAVTREHGIPVVEDAACALGAWINDRPCGTFADMACFSFHPRKIVTTGEGGMLTTDHAEFGPRVRRLRQHGGERVDNRFTFVEPGFNYRMSDINAAMGVAQMRKLDRIVAERRRLAGVLGEAIRGHGLEGVRLPSEPPGYRHTFQSYVVLLAEGIDRDGVIRRMAERKVETTVGTYALHLEEYFRKLFGDVDLPNAALAWRQALTLPLYPGLTDADMRRVAEALAESLR